MIKLTPANVELMLYSLGSFVDDAVQLGTSAA